MTPITIEDTPVEMIDRLNVLIKWYNECEKERKEGYTMTKFQYYMQKAVNEVYDGTDNEFYALCDFIDDCQKCPIRFKCQGLPDREEIAAWLREEYNNAENDNTIGQSDNEKEAGEASGS